MRGYNHITTGFSTVVIIDTILKTIQSKFGYGICTIFRNAINPASMLDTGNKIVTGILTGAICTAVFLLGCLLPDCDLKTSIIGKVFYVPVRHRTWTHTIWIILILLILSYVNTCFIWLAYGYFLHIFYDSLSKGGICWFYPISKYLNYSSGAQIKKGHKIYLYKTSEISEKIVAGVIFAIGIMCAIYNISLGPIS